MGAVKPYSTKVSYYMLGSSSSNSERVFYFLSYLAPVLTHPNPCVNVYIKKKVFWL